MHDSHSPDDDQVPESGHQPSAHDNRPPSNHANSGSHSDNAGSLDADCCAALKNAPPGTELARALSGIRLDNLSAYELVAVVQAWERQKAYASACSR